MNTQLYSVHNHSVMQAVYTYMYIVHVHVYYTSQGALMLIHSVRQCSQLMASLPRWLLGDVALVASIPTQVSGARRCGKYSHTGEHC